MPHSLPANLHLAHYNVVLVESQSYDIMKYSLCQDLSSLFPCGRETDKCGLLLCPVSQGIKNGCQIFPEN